MASKARDMIVQLIFAAIGVIVGYFVYIFLYFALFVLYGEYGAPDWLVRLIHSPLPSVVFGFLGLWIGLRRTSSRGKAIYPLAFIFIFSIPALQLIQARNVHLTPDAAAKASLTSLRKAGYSTNLTLSRMTEEVTYRVVLYQVKDGDTAIGTVDAIPYMGFFWESSEFHPRLPETLDEFLEECRLTRKCS